MPTLTIPDLSDRTLRVLSERAQQHGCDIGTEIKSILDAVARDSGQVGLGTALAEIGRRYGGVELDIARDRAEFRPADLG